MVKSARERHASPGGESMAGRMLCIRRASHEPYGVEALVGPPLCGLRMKLEPKCFNHFQNRSELWTAVAREGFVKAFSG